MNEQEQPKWLEATKVNDGIKSIDETCDGCGNPDSLCTCMTEGNNERGWDRQYGGGASR